MTHALDHEGPHIKDTNFTVVVVARAQSGKRFRVVADDHGVHAFGDRDLPGIVFTHALIGAALVEGGTLALLTPDSLPAKITKFLTHTTTS